MLTLDIGIDRERFEVAANIEIGAGVTGLFGASGSGKSTLLGAIAGLVKPTRGTIRLASDVLFDASRGINQPPHRRRIGLVFQDSLLFPHFSVKANLHYGWERTPTAERRFKFDDIIDLLALAPLLDAHPRRISGGERQRVALGRALLAAPRMLLLDEPLASLDGRLKAQILPFLRRIRDELRLPMIYVSHTLAEIVQLTDDLILLDTGQVVAHGPLPMLLTSRAGESAAGFHLDNVLPVIIESHDVEDGCTLARFGELSLALPLRGALAPGETTYVSVHRGDIALARQPVTGVSIQNQLAGRVTAIEHHDGAVQVRFNAGAPLLAEVTPRSFRDLDLRVGQAVHGLIKTRSFIFLAEQIGQSAGSAPSPTP